MNTPTRIFFLTLALFASAACAQQTVTPDPQPVQTQQQPAAAPGVRSAGGDVGHGSEDIGKGAGGAAGNVAKGTGKGAVDLVTLHPVDAAGNVGKGVGVGAKDAGVGVAKGTGDIAKGTGRGIGHLFHHSHHDSAPAVPPN
jgi:hypothetical protein